MPYQQAERHQAHFHSQTYVFVYMHTVIIANSHLMLRFISVQVIKSVSNV